MKTRAPLTHLALLAALGLFLLGEFPEPIFLKRLGCLLALLLAVSSCTTIASFGLATWRDAWRVCWFGAGTQAAADPHVSRVAQAIASQGQVVRDLALSFAVMRICEPILAIAQAVDWSPRAWGAAMSDAIVFGALGLLVGEMFFGRVARETRAHVGLPSAPPSLWPLSFLVLPALTLFFVTYSL